MRTFLQFVIAVVASFIIGVGAMLASASLVPCRSDKAGCGLGSAYQAFLVPIETVAVAIAMGLALLSARRLNAIRRAALTLVLAPFFVLVLGLASDLYQGRSTQLADILNLLQTALPFCSIVLVQWLLLRGFVLQTEQRQSAGGATNG